MQAWRESKPSAYRGEGTGGCLFGLHEQTVRAYLRRRGVKLRPLRALTETQEAEVVKLYAEETWSLAELAARFEVCQTAIRNV